MRFIHLIRISLLFVTVTLSSPRDLFAQEIFHTRIDYPVGNCPGSVFSIDFNGDGDNDLVTTNSQSDNMSILLNLTGPYVTINEGFPIEPFELHQNTPNPFNTQT